MSTDDTKDQKEKTQKAPRRRRKTMNLDTYKVHALGDYVETIRTYGTCDSYSTERVRKYGTYQGDNGYIFHHRVSLSTVHQNPYIPAQAGRVF